MNNRSIRIIANEIVQNWPKINYAALPYLQAMLVLDTIRDKYYEDSARSIVLYFLSNASGFRGDIAKRIKLELKAML